MIIIVCEKELIIDIHTFIFLCTIHLSRISSQSVWHTECSTTIYCGGMCIMYVGYSFERFCSNTVSGYMTFIFTVFISLCVYI